MQRKHGFLRQPARNAGKEKIVLKTARIELYKSEAAHRHVGTYAKAKLCAGAMISAKRM
jgi:hypothetical protein